MRAVGAFRYSHWWLDRCVLYVGRMTEAKGVPLIVEAWLRMAGKLGRACPALWLVGGLPEEIEAVRRAVGIETLQEFENEGRIRWWGYLDFAGISTLLLKAYVLVTHSLYEPGGRVVLEAMSQGIPVIATPHGFAADLIVDWHTGFLVDHGDVDALMNRMQHFALQPLLRHAMGRVAQRTALAALNRWNFMTVHLNAYEQALEGRRGVRSEIATQPWAINRKRPQGFGGVYPFESEDIRLPQVLSFFEKACGRPEQEPVELEVNSGRSRLWVASRGTNSFVIKHAFSTYRRRPMWDLGFGGSVAEIQRARVSNEVLSATCAGVAPILASDLHSGLLLRRWVNPVKIEASALDTYAAVLIAFHKSRPPGLDFQYFQNSLHRNWREMGDDDVVAEVDAMQKLWHSDRYYWHPWQPMSLRLGWRWVDIGLRKEWVSLPLNVREEVIAHLPIETGVADDEASGVSFGVCHGDCEPDNFGRNDTGELVLIDGERFHPGYFGSDWATLLLRLLNSGTEPNAIDEVITHASNLVRPVLYSRNLLLSWLKLSIVMDLCRSHALMNTEAVATAVLRWHQLSSLHA